MEDDIKPYSFLEKMGRGDFDLIREDAIPPYEQKGYTKARCRWPFYAQLHLLAMSNTVSGCTLLSSRREEMERQLPSSLGIMRDYKRLFPGLEHIDVERAMWSFATSPDSCDQVFRRFVMLDARINEILHGDEIYPESRHTAGYDEVYPEFRHIASYDYALDLKVLGTALWQVSCHVPRSLSPAPPPPPYTLYAFNIELPPIKYVNRAIRSSGKRKISDVVDVDQIRKQRLLRFEGGRIVAEGQQDASQGRELRRIMDMPMGNEESGVRLAHQLWG